MSSYDFLYPPYSAVYFFTENFPRVFIIADVPPLTVTSTVNYKEKILNKKKKQVKRTTE